MPSTLHVKLLGQFRLTWDDEPVNTVNSPRLQSLLAYLVLHHDAPQSRQYLSFRFWPDSTEAQARTNLRQLLHHLRRALPEAEDLIHADTQTVQWKPGASFTLDVADFESAVLQVDAAEAPLAQSAAQEHLEKAVQLYRGDLLPSCYDEWIEPEREHFRQAYITALDHLIELLEARRSYQSAIEYARLLLQKDPLREATYRCLMRLHALNKDRASALRVYHECTAALQRELNVEPGPSTRELHERLLDLEEPPVSGSKTQHTFLAGELPLVGRRQEWKQLQAAWHATIKGQARLVAVMGEAGVGKTRLAEELLAWTGRQGFPAAQGRCYAAEGRLAYAPVTDWLRSDIFRTTLSGLNDVWRTEIARILPELSPERPEPDPPQPVTDGQRRQQFFEALARTVVAAPQPLLLVIDDLQWCDHDTLKWLRYLLRFTPPAKLLIVGTVRIEEIETDHPLQSLLLDLRRAGQMTEIMLGPLDASETMTLASHVATEELDSTQAQRLYQETEGNPLFVVESVRANLVQTNGQPPILDKPTSAAPSVLNRVPSLPPKVRAVLTARLTQLSPEARKLTGLAAVVGRAFTFKILASASNHNEDDLVQALDELWQRRIIREQGADAYDFSHDKLREAAYAALSPVRRRLLHRRVGQALEAVHAGKLDAVSGQIASHYERAGMPEQARSHYQRAARVAQGVYAHAEAIDYLKRALALLKHRPESRERDMLEIDLQIPLGLSLVPLKGYGAPEVHAACDRIRELYRHLEEPPPPPVSRALAIGRLVIGDLPIVEELGKQLLDVGQKTQDTVVLVEGHYVLGVVRFWQGNFSVARTHLEQAIDLYDPQQQETHITLYTQDPKVVCLVRLGLCLWYLGYPEQAQARCREALALARDLSHPLSLAYALNYAAWLANNLQDLQATEERSRAAMETVSERQLGFWEPTEIVLLGWIQARKGDLQDGISQMCRGISTYENTGETLHLPYTSILLTQAYQRSGETDRGLATLNKALSIMEKTGQRFLEAELYRLKGELLLAADPHASEAENCFCRALNVARRQEAKSLELRAAMSLSRLWQRRETKTEARQELQEVYDRFTEGFDTPDVKEAEALLKKLS